MGAMFADDGERDRAAAVLREHYARGRLTLDELSNRTERVLTARSRGDLRAALAGLPLQPDMRELADNGRRMAQLALRGVTLLVFTSAYLVFSFLLMFLFAATLLLRGASGLTLLGFLVVWLVPTYLLSRLWRRRRPYA
jgi:uncharacterized protein DUF1707